MSHDPTTAGSLSTSSSLIGRVKRNEGDAWRTLVDLYSPLVYVWCRRTKLPAQEAADVMQDVFHAVARNIERFRSDRQDDTFRGWLYVITRHAANDRIRAIRRQPQATGGSAFLHQLQELREESEESGSVSPEKADLYRRALELVKTDFQAKTWQAAMMMIAEGRAAVDVADELGMSAGAVRNAKYKVLRRLREELGEVE